MLVSFDGDVEIIINISRLMGSGDEVLSPPEKTDTVIFLKFSIIRKHSEVYSDD